MIRIIIVEDQAMLRESLVAAIGLEADMEVVAAIGDAAEAVRLVEELAPDLVLMDICTDMGSSGIVATKKIKESGRSVPVVLMTAMPEMTFVRQAREAGADSFIYKNVGTRDLLSVLRSTVDGYSTYPGVSRGGGIGGVELSDDEIAVLRLACEAKSRKEIADALFLSEGTVKRRISEMLAKTGYDNIFKLAVTAVSNGFIVPQMEQSD